MTLNKPGAPDALARHFTHAKPRWAGRRRWRATAHMLVLGVALLALVPSAASARPKWQVSCPTSSSTYKTNVMNTSGLVSYWRLDETSGTIACDSKGSSRGSYNSGTTLGQAGALSGDGNSAVALNGNGGSVDMPSSSNLNPSAQISLEAWVRPSATSSSQTVVRKDGQYLLRLNGQTVVFRIWTGGTLVELTTPNVLTSGVYQHLMATYDGSQMRIYRNGSQVAARSLSGSIGQSSSTLYLGESGGYDYFNGRLDEVALYNRALSGSQVQSHYTAGSGSSTSPTPPSDTTAPSTPTGLSASAGDSNVTLSWSASSDNVGVTGYNVYRNGTKVGSTGSPGYVDSGLNNGTSYSYYVTAYDAAGNNSTGSSSVSATPQATTSPTPVPGGCSGVTWSNGWGTFSNLSWPDECWRPYGDTAPINTKFGESTNYRSNSAEMVASARNGYPIQSTYVSAGSDDWYHPYYFNSSTDPLYTIHCTQYACPTMEGQQVRIPTKAQPAGGGDGHMAILDQPTNTEWDFWKASVPSGSGGTLNVATGGKLALNGNGIIGGGSSNQSGATAANMGLIAGPVRPEELQAGDVPHALFMVAYCTNGTHVYPAIGNARTCGDANQPPDGQLFKLDYTDAEIDALSVPAWKKPILKALAHYGAYVQDTGGGGGIGIQFVSQQQYASTGTQGWSAFAGQPGVSGSGNSLSFNLDSGVDWSRLRAVNPCVVQKTC